MKIDVQVSKILFNPRNRRISKDTFTFSPTHNLKNKLPVATKIKEPNENIIQIFTSFRIVLFIHSLSPFSLASVIADQNGYSKIEKLKVVILMYLNARLYSVTTLGLNS